MDPATLAVAGAGISSAFGQFLSNRSDRHSVREQMAFQERMRSNQYQTAVADMRAAGLNPILAAGSSAGVPSGAAAKSEDALSKGVSSAIAARRMVKELEAIESGADKNRADIALAKAQERLIREQTKATASSARNVDVDIAQKLLQTPAIAAESKFRTRTATSNTPYAEVDAASKNKTRFGLLLLKNALKDWSSTAKQVGATVSKDIGDTYSGVSNVVSKHYKELQSYNKKHSRKK